MTFYVKTEDAQGVTGRVDYPSLSKAREMAALVRKYATSAVRAVYICRESGRIVASWDRDEQDRWYRSLS